MAIDMFLRIVIILETISYGVVFSLFKIISSVIYLSDNFFFFGSSYEVIVFLEVLKFPIFNKLNIIIINLEYWSFGVFEFWSFGVLEYWSFGVLE